MSIPGLSNCTTLRHTLYVQYNIAKRSLHASSMRETITLLQMFSCNIVHERKYLHIVYIFAPNSLHHYQHIVVLYWYILSQTFSYPAPSPPTPHPKSIECFIEDQALLRSHDTASRPPSPPLSHQQAVSLFQSSCELTDGWGGGGRVGEEPNHSLLCAYPP